MRRAPLLLTLALAVAAIAGAAMPAGAATIASSDARGCPSPARCNVYRVGPHRWKTQRGVAILHYRIATLQPWLLPDQVIDAVDAATQTWEAANPNVRFVFDGVTRDVPQLGNNVNEIAWVGTLEPDVIALTNFRAKGATRLETDTLLNVAKPREWNPCEQASGACSDASGTGLRFVDLQAVITQQFGHWLGLETVTHPAARELTMFAGGGYGQRHQSTLGLGDVTGVRRAYPCGKCRKAQVFVP